jgi:solute carrier family 35 (UDP-galactose transporter), member B1
MVPIMVMSFLVYGRHDGWKEYGFSIAIAVGATLFLAGKGSHNRSETNNKWWLWGPLLVVVGIVLAAYTNVAQDLFYLRFDVSPFLVLMWMNGFSAVFFAIWMSISGEFRKAWSTVLRNWTLARDIIGFSLAGALGHLVIFYFVREFGSLTNAYACTLRKFNSILLSVIMYGHPVSFSQWAGVSVVFAALFAKLM